MTPTTARALADAVLALHTLTALFIIFGFSAIFAGSLRGWRWIRIAWWRVLHAGAMLTVALQKVLGETCFLTVWENRLLAIAKAAPRPVPIVHTWGGGFVHLPGPFWLLVAAYCALAALALVLLLTGPIDWPTRKRKGPRRISRRGPSHIGDSGRI